jgi:hypothetical protein
MNRYRCYLRREDDDDIVDIREIAAEFDVKAVLLARAMARRVGCPRFELHHHQRVVRREDNRQVCLGDEYGAYSSITLGDEIKD